MGFICEEAMFSHAAPDAKLGRPAIFIAALIGSDGMRSVSWICASQIFTLAGSGASSMRSECIWTSMPHTVSRSDGPSVLSGSRMNQRADMTSWMSFKVAAAMEVGMAVKMSSTFLNMGMPMMSQMMAAIAAQVRSQP